MPETGTTSNKGNLFITKGETANIPIAVLDGFGSYPLWGNRLGPILDQLEEDYFIKRLGVDVRKRGIFTVLANPKDGIKTKK